MTVLYVIIVLLASVVGAISGIGGGVIIKPALDAISPYNTFVIGVLSCFAVLTMAIVSVVKHLFYKTPINFSVAVPLGIGSIAGGIVGDMLFSLARSGADDHVIKIIQASILIVLLVFVIVYMVVFKNKQNPFHIKNWFITALTGMALGVLSTFIGIGGGPVNIAILCMFFGMDMKDSSVNSLVMIVFSQLAKMVTMTVNGDLLSPDLPWWTILAMCVVAVIGGLIGSSLNKRMKNQHILVVYTTTMAVIIGINVYNIIANAIALVA